MLIQQPVQIKEVMEIQYYKKDVWGNTLLYPVDYAYAIELITGKKTLTNATIKGLQMMGFCFQEVMESAVKKGGVK